MVKTLDHQKTCNTLPTTNQGLLGKPYIAKKNQYISTKTDINILGSFE